MNSGERVKAIAQALDATKVYVADGREPLAALDAVNVSIRPGEMVALMGPSGCGKSTLLNLFGCIDLPTSGAIVIDGAVTSQLGDDALTRLRRERIGTVFQFFNVLPALTLRENVALPLRLAGAAAKTIDARVDAVLRAVDIVPLADAYPANVSGGQMQRAAIARAVVARPALVLADEPTGNLDSASGAAVLRLLRELADAGQALLMATHSGEAAAVCDRVIHMQDGRIVETSIGAAGSSG